MNKHTAQLLEQHFDAAFAAPNGIAKLRELILTLAMQGKLVEQDPSDPPASELLKEIDAEKQRLVNEGKIKQPKPLPPIKPEEVPYELPQGWEWVRLGNIGHVGSSSRVHQRDWKEEGVPFYRAREIVKLSSLGFVKNELYISETHYQSIAKDGLIPEANDLMITGVGTIGVPYIVKKTDRFYFKDASVLIFKNMHRLYAPFLFMFFKSPFWIERIYDGSMGTTVHTLTISRTNEILVPLPPLSEQYRIVARIDQLMARCDELEKLRKERDEKRLAVHAAAIKQLLDAPNGKAWDFIQEHFGELYTVKENVTELRKAVLQLAVMGRLAPQDPNDPPVSELLKEIEAERQRLEMKKSSDLGKTTDSLDYEIPNHWEWACLNDLIVYGPTNGFSPRAVDYETYIRSLTLSATTSGTFKGEHSKFIDAEIPEDSELWLRDGDILVQRGNTLEYVGVPAVYRGKSNVFIYPDLMMKFRVSSQMDTDYVYYAMSSVPSRNYLRVHASGTSGTMPKINQKILKSLPIPIPPFEEQKRIVSKVKKMLDCCEILGKSIDTSLSKQKELLTALMAQV
ncbi:restriction endonuclease subunit S [Nitrincola sp. MINF-07-Sa-05]|uniref:restriction endonuclease subunit S n=1 Tax=Nitrincola salilacus TaxID=3400273 RepID=UPI003917C694